MAGRRPRARKARPEGALPHAEKRRIIVEAKARPCCDCGYEFPTEAMDFDHVRGRKKFTISGRGYRTLVELLEEIAKCEVVCACCHRIRTTRRAKMRRKRGKRP